MLLSIQRIQNVLYWQNHSLLNMKCTVVKGGGVKGQSQLFMSFSHWGLVYLMPKTLYFGNKRAINQLKEREKISYTVRTISVFKQIMCPLNNLHYVPWPLSFLNIMMMSSWNSNSPTNKQLLCWKSFIILNSSILL